MVAQSDRTMTTETHNKLHIFFNTEAMPYLYCVVHRVDSSLDNQWWEKPFILSKRKVDGKEVVYGTIRRTIDKIFSQLGRLEQFSSVSRARLEAAGIEIDDEPKILSDSELENSIVDEQEELVEDVLISISVNVRILSEVFPNKLKNTVNVYNYEEALVGSADLGSIANLLLHNRCLVIKGYHVVDLLSQEEFLIDTPQMGLQFDFNEYIEEVQKAINDLTFKDLIGVLWGITKRLVPTSNIADIVFLTQNLYALGEVMVGPDARIESGPLKAVLDRIAIQHLDRLFPRHRARGKVEATINVLFQAPRFYLEPDLDNKQIRTEVHVGTSPGALEKEQLVMGYEDFFSELSAAAGTRRLYA